MRYAKENGTESRKKIKISFFFCLFFFTLMLNSTVKQSALPTTCWEMSSVGSTILPRFNILMECFSSWLESSRSGMTKPRVPFISLLDSCKKNFKNGKHYTATIVMHVSQCHNTACFLPFCMRSQQNCTAVESSIHK